MFFPVSSVGAGCQVGDGGTVVYGDGSWALTERTEIQPYITAAVAGGKGGGGVTDSVEFPQLRPFMLKREVILILR